MKVNDGEVQRLNMLGFSDHHIARILELSQSSITCARYRMGLKPNYKPWSGDNINPIKAYAKMKEYQKTDKRKEYRKEYQKTDKRKEYQKEYYQRKKAERGVLE